MPRRTKTQSLGQHFLVDRRVLARIIDASAVGKDETVCEAGTGNGILTQELCRRARKVLSYEVDKALHAKARETLAFPNLELVNKDLFKTDVGFDVFVSNLPYSRSRDALEWLAVRKFNRAVVMVQKEFAQKLLAGPGDENYRAVSVIASHCFSIEPLFDVGRNCFEPSPKVESTLIRMIPKNTVVKETITKVNRLFSQRNKRASKVAARLGAAKDFGTRRIDQLTSSEIVALAGGDVMYVPAEDTFLLMECVQKYAGQWALEIGVGSGAVAQSLATNFKNVVGTDINPASLAYCRGRGLLLVCCDAASALANVKFDLIVSNPPYLPDDSEKDLTVHGGPAGIETTLHFVESALPLLSKSGRMLFVVSSLADSSALDSLAKKKNLKKKVVKEKALFYERLYVVELTF